MSPDEVDGILAIYDDFYSSLYFDRLNPRPQDEQQLFQRLDQRHGSPGHAAGTSGSARYGSHDGSCHHP